MNTFTLHDRHGNLLGNYSSPEAAMTATSEIGMRSERYGSNLWVLFSEGGVAKYVIKGEPMEPPQ